MKLIDYLLIIWLFTCYTQVRNNLIQCAKDITNGCGRIAILVTKGIALILKLFVKLYYKWKRMFI